MSGREDISGHLHAETSIHVNIKYVLAFDGAWARAAARTNDSRVCFDAAFQPGDIEDPGNALQLLFDCRRHGHGTAVAHAGSLEIPGEGSRISALRLDRRVDVNTGAQHMLVAIQIFDLYRFATVDSRFVIDIKYGNLRGGLRHVRL